MKLLDRIAINQIVHKFIELIMYVVKVFGPTQEKPEDKKQPSKRKKILPWRNK